MPTQPSPSEGMHIFASESHGLHISVRPVYLAEQSDPDASRYVWAYTVTIENGGKDVVQLRDRAWEIVDGNGRVEHVRGPGVVGEQPVMRPGERFEYTSGCPLATPSGFMSGHYTMVREDGSTFQVSIPPFSLDKPNEVRTLN